jgi:hypothetical protein
MSTLIPRKSFTVFIYDKEYDVWDIEGKEHEGLNGEPKTWWLYHSERLPEGLIPPADSEYFLPYHCSIERLVWEISFKQKTTTKNKWGNTQFRSNTQIEMWCNGKLIYSFSTTGGERGLAYAMAKVQYLQVHLAEHPFNFFDPQTENGRKIFWFGLPAFVKVKSDGWEIAIIPDYEAGLSKEEWWQHYEIRRKPVNPTYNQKEDDEDIFGEDDSESDYINWGDALSDQYIIWSRPNN